ncbi:hypothetical protein PMAA_015470 [Talaromyces marneffei ATCC 18224]|uniref:Uncharacterized protein n=1 Tax=Talaromyces marneffei (strain ATCC 18224 / CBS 334.59 / QM 7333) TaxID=441960 RepID=B6Q6U1_TALMQ|nr:hypothetical protein PMAA_015470 [Talaromyces marneffei ATCC 18224]
MATFRRLAWYFLDEAETLCSIQDDLTNLSRGFSFVQHPKNRLMDAYLELANRACIYRQHHLFHNGQWNRQSIYKYIDRDERLRKLLMGVLYTTGGQVPRIPKLSSLEYVNGPSTERGFYVWNGSIIYLTRHHKAKRSTNREFFVVRFLPAQGGRLLYQYLVYIRPFIQMLKDEMTGLEIQAREEYKGSYIFCPKWHGPP